MRALSKLLFAAYLFILLWLVLFKFSYDPMAVILDFQSRSLSFIPFARGNKNEMIANIVAFIPFGVLVSNNSKRLAFRYKLAVIFAFSLTVEIVQFAMAIGVADITDVILNTLGGFIGLAGYLAVSKNTNDRYLDICILGFGMLVLLAVLYLRIFVFIVRY